MQDFYTQLHNALLEHNIHIIGEINLNKTGVQRLRSSSGKGKDVFIIIHPNQQGATFGDWHDYDAKTKWRMSGAVSKLSPEEHAKRAASQKIRELEALRHREHAIKRAIRFYESVLADTMVDKQAYVMKKRINPYCAKRLIRRRWLTDILVIPVRDIHYKLVSVQIIKPNGFKRAWKGTTHKDHMVWLHPRLPTSYAGAIRLVEGYATGCTVYQATGEPTICALNAHNMPNVAVLLRQYYQHAILKICADNDQWGKANTGLKYAIKAAQLTNASLYWPDFKGINVSSHPTDFNDVYLLTNIETAKEQLTSDDSNTN